MRKVSDFLYKKANFRGVLISFVMIIVLFAALPLTEQVFNIDEDAISLDKPVFMNTRDTYEVLESWGDEGRLGQFYLHATWDIALPIAYFVFLGYLTSCLIKIWGKEKNKAHLMNLVSLVALVDILENIFLFGLIVLHPTQIGVISWAKLSMTYIKYYVFGPLIVIVLLVSVFMILRQKVRMK